MKCLTIVFPALTCLVGLVVCNFYMGMFQKNDLLVAQDRLYKEKVPYRIQYAKYGRVFKCPITYLRVVDRLGYGPAPKTKIIRGGLQKKYVVLRLSAYNRPISVNIYVGCQNKRKLTTTKAKPRPKPTNQKPTNQKPTNNQTSKDEPKANATDSKKEDKGNDTNSTANGTDDGGNKTEDGGNKTDDAKKDDNGTDDANKAGADNGTNAEAPNTTT